MQVVAVQAVALYGAKIWWNDQKGWCAEYEKQINRQERAVRGMFRTALRAAVVREVGLRPAVSLLNSRQRRYGYCLLATL